MSLARLLQYSKDSQTYGSQLASLSFIASYFEGKPESESEFEFESEHRVGDVLRKIAVAHLRELNETNVVSLLHKKPNGVVIILPPTLDSRKTWHKLERFFCTSAPSTPLDDESFPIPIYFAYESPAIMDMYEALRTRALELENAATACTRLSHF